VRLSDPDERGAILVQVPDLVALTAFESKGRNGTRFSDSKVFVKEDDGIGTLAPDSNYPLRFG